MGENTSARWIWYPGDLEMYHALKQNFVRSERGMGWPAYWKSSSYHQRIALWREYVLTEETAFRVHARGTGFVRVIEEEMPPVVSQPVTAGELSSDNAQPENKEEAFADAPKTARAEDGWALQEISRSLERRETKHAFGETIHVRPGKVTVIIHVGRIEALPAAYVEGDVIHSGISEEGARRNGSSEPGDSISGTAKPMESGWLADDYASHAIPAGSSPYFMDPGQDPAEWRYAEKRYEPIRMEAVEGGTLYEWETELTASLQIEAPEARLREMTVYPGESREEALDPVHCYLRWTPEIRRGGSIPCGKNPSAAVYSAESVEAAEVPELPVHDRTSDIAVGITPRSAVHFAFIPGDPVKVTAVHQYVDFPQRASFTCEDPLLNRIWEVAEHTFRLCAGIFFIDGIKRDQWIWSGDAYQSLFVNRYLLADPDIERRTLRALRGDDPVKTHINTIVDYSLFWILGVKEHMDSAGDAAFLREIWPKVESLLDFVDSRRNEDGFLVGRERDWVYIDWADLDKEGPVAGEQMLLAAAWRAVGELTEILAEQSSDSSLDSSGGPVRREPSSEEYRSLSVRYRRLAEDMERRIREKYWSDEAGAYIDSFTSGRNHISRQTNILALRTGIALPEQIPQIAENVLKNDAVPAIKTPYFQFYALDAMGQLGEYEEILSTIRSYWGGMIDRGAVTFWEEYDPAVTGRAQYDMYGDAFGKSLCHAWAASPVYLIARYIVGLVTVQYDIARKVFLPQDAAKYPGLAGANTPNGVFCASANAVCDCEERSSEQLLGLEPMSGERDEGLPTFRLTPQLSLLNRVDCTLPVGMDGAGVCVRWDAKQIRVRAEGCRGTLILGDREYVIGEAVETVLPLAE